MEDKINIGDKVYWGIRIGMFRRTLSGEVIEINDDVATVSVQTQNIYGKHYKKNIGCLTKNKKQ